MESHRIRENTCEYKYTISFNWFKLYNFSLTFYLLQVRDSNYVIQDSSGNTIDTQYISLDEFTKNVRELYVQAYLGHKPEVTPKFLLVFQVTVQPLGWNTYFISKAARGGRLSIVIFFNPDLFRYNLNLIDYYIEGKLYRILSNIYLPRSNNTEVGPGNLKMVFSSTGQLQRMYNSRTGV